MPWSQTLDATVPGDTGFVSAGAGNIRNLTEAMIERLNSLFADVNADPLVSTGLVGRLAGAGAPTSGGAGTGANLANPGSTYFDTTNKICYMNINTLASPTWAPILLGDSV